MTTISELYEQIREEHRNLSQELDRLRGNNRSLKSDLEHANTVIHDLQEELKMWRHKSDWVLSSENWKDLYEQADQEVDRLQAELDRRNSPEEPGVVSQEEYVAGYRHWEGLHKIPGSSPKIQGGRDNTAPEALWNYQKSQQRMRRNNVL